MSKRVENVPVRVNGRLAGTAVIHEDGSIEMSKLVGRDDGRDLFYFAERGLLDSLEIGWNSTPAMLYERT